MRWSAIAIAFSAAVALGGAVGEVGQNFLNAGEVRPVPGLSNIQAQPIPTLGQGPDVTPMALPGQVFLPVPFTTQAPLNNWAEHQESCEAANLTMLYLYWNKDQSVVVDPRTADSWIATIDSWKPSADLNDNQVGELASNHWGFTYMLVPNDRQVIAQQLAAGRPLLAEVRTHGLGNGHYPGYYNHYEQTGWSVPHFVTIIGYDATGVWLNDPGISWGRGYHITYEQLTHAIDDLDQHHPSLNLGQVLLLIAPTKLNEVGNGLRG